MGAIAPSRRLPCVGVGSGKWEVGSGKWEVGSGKWEVGSGKWEVGSGKWEVGSGKWEVRWCVSADAVVVSHGFIALTHPTLES